MALPPLTPDQRAAALEKAAKARKDRAEVKNNLKRGSTTLPAALVLDSSGGFHAGDRVYVVTRGTDGGQGVIATGTIRCDAIELAESALLVWP